MSQFAKRVDHRFDTDMQRFIITYQKLKYGTHTIRTDEQTFLTQYGKRFTNELDQQIPAGERRKNWLFVRRALRFVAGRKESSV
ncbi:MAG: hypothetical protein KL787_03340 [Taibaiella sp.]|nr:hypothetical protein [Taibaiella sp.]